MYKAFIIFTLFFLYETVVLLIYLFLIEGILIQKLKWQQLIRAPKKLWWTPFHTKLAILLQVR